MSTPKTRYALFAWEDVKQRAPHDAWSMVFMAEPKEPWQEGDEEKDKPKQHLAFVAFVSSPAEVVEAVRKDPVRRYVLMTGTIEAVQIAMPVFVGGKNLSTLDSEWRDEA